MEKADVYYCLATDCDEDFLVPEGKEPKQCPFCGSEEWDFETTKRLY